MATVAGERMMAKEGGAIRGWRQQSAAATTGGERMTGVGGRRQRRRGGDGGVDGVAATTGGQRGNLSGLGRGRGGRRIFFFNESRSSIIKMAHIRVWGRKIFLAVVQVIASLIHLR